MSAALSFGNWQTKKGDLGMGYDVEVSGRGRGLLEIEVDGAGIIGIDGDDRSDFVAL